MKKTILLSMLIMMSAVLFSQNDTTKVQVPKDSITQVDVAKHIYLTGLDWQQFLSQCYADSIPVTEFYGKPISGEYWKTKLRYYLDPWDAIPPGAKYIHRKPSWALYSEFMMIKYNQR